MFVRIDHVMIAAPDLDRGMEQYGKLGFSSHPGGDHPGKGTHNAIAFNSDDYLELLAIRDLAEYQAASSASTSWDGGLGGSSSRPAAASATSSSRATTSRGTSRRCAVAASMSAM